MANIAAASPRQPAASRCPQRGRVGSGACRVALAGRGGWAGPASWAPSGSRGLPEGCNSPKVHGSQSFLIRQSDLLLLLCGLLAPLALSLSLVLTSPYRRSFSSPVFLACGMPGGSRAMPSPYQGTLACPKPGPPGIFRLHVTNPLMQSSDVVAGCAAVWPLMGRSSSSFPPVRL